MSLSQMKTISFLVVISLIIGAFEVRRASSKRSRDFSDTLGMRNCDSIAKRLACDRIQYRTFDGTCNNLCFTYRGATFQPLRRLQSLKQTTAYEPPGFGPRRSSVIRGQALPNARSVSVNVFQSTNRDLNNKPSRFTHLVMAWGVFLDHDITLTEMEDVMCGTNTNACPRRPSCIGIDILRGQGLRADRSFKCIPLTRSSRDQNGQQINLLTSYIDGSQVYGSDIGLATRLRGRQGLLDVRPYNRQPALPVLPPADDQTFCRSANRRQEPCFLAGDERVNENHALSTLHVIWVREHNRIAKRLRSLNPRWNDERLFQVARKIVGAEMQHITYNEWLPVLFSRSVLIKEGLCLERRGRFYNGYSPSANAEMINSVPTAALRMGHTLIRNTFALRNSKFGSGGFGQPGSEIPVADFFNPGPLFERGNNPFGGILLGLVRFPSQAVDGFFVEAIRERLIVDGPGFNGTFGDLPAINIQRGRDHGLPGYVKFREACGGRPANSFGDLANTIRRNDRRNLAKIYRSVHDVDLFVGGILERPARGSVLGPTFTHLLTRQFRDLRQGDRFWYERNHELGFTLRQLDEIRKATISRIICDNSDGVIRIQRQGFKLVNRRSNPLVRCRNLRSVDLRVFKEV